jgi:hypothetical protein
MATAARTQPDLPPDSPKPEAEHQALLTWLQGKGVPAATATNWIGSSAAGRTRRQIATALHPHLVVLPKATGA